MGGYLDPTTCWLAWAFTLDQPGYLGKVLYCTAYIRKRPKNTATA